MGTSETVDELRELRRGRGLGTDDLHRRVGPRLRLACEIADADGPAVVRHKITLQLAELCGRLPADLKLAALVAFALHGEASGQFFHERLQWLADHLDRDTRTARRRIDQAFRLLAEHLGEHQAHRKDDNKYAPDGWYVEATRAVLRMDLDLPQLTEEYTIVATAEGLDEIVISVTAPKGNTPTSNREIEAEVVYGGEIVERRREALGLARFVIRLPQPLELGQRHEYCIQFKSYPREHMSPFYALIPWRSCKHFAARVRFGGKCRPDLIWRLNGVPHELFAEFKPNDQLLTIDRVGDVSIEFHDLKQGLYYGVQWRP